jgi:hypothetical protein
MSFKLTIKPSLEGLGLTKCNNKNMDLLISIYFSEKSSKPVTDGYLRGKSTNGSNLGTSVVVGNVVVGRNHDISISSVREGVAIGFVKVAGSRGVAGAVVRVVGHARRRRSRGGPTRLEGSSGCVGGISVHRVPIDSVANQSLGRSGCCAGDASSRNLEK